MNLLFIVQGEGRGHMTQALALRAMLERAGHDVTRVLAGSVRHRELPDYFVEKIGAPVERFGSPGFSVGANHRSIRPIGTIVENVARAPEYGQALRQIDDAMAAVRPDLVVTFYEPMAGIYQTLYRPDVPFVAIGHQYMFEHPAYTFAPGRRFDRSGLTLFTRLTAVGAACKLALSLYPAPDLTDDRLYVLPPLLRKAVRSCAKEEPAREPFYLIYLLNRGYAEQVMDWHREHPDVRLECFRDDPDAEDVVEHDETLRFHRLNDVTFLEMMARCSGLACTAGFESVSEALYLGKPVLAVPVEGHFEQRCNAYEVEMLGAGIRADTFDLGLLADYPVEHRLPTAAFRRWAAQAEGRVIEVIEAVASGKRPPERRSIHPTDAAYFDQDVNRDADDDVDDTRVAQERCTYVTPAPP
ncbi:MAG: glycosyltransferase family protein [Rhodothermales bacterium]